MSTADCNACGIQSDKRNDDKALVWVTQISVKRHFRPLAEVSGSTLAEMPLRTVWTETPANNAIFG